MEEDNNTNSKTGVVYITDNENLFIASEGLSQKEFRRLSLETDRDALKEKLAAIEAQLNSEEEIERPEKSEQSEEIVSETDIKAVTSNVMPETQPLTVVFGQTILPSFALMTEKGLKNIENAKVQSFDKNTGMYLLDNGNEKILLPKETFESILTPAWQDLKKETGKTILAENGHAIVNDTTVIPEFAMITQHGLQSFKNMNLLKFNKAENTYTIGNNDSSITLQAETFSEVIAPDRFEKNFTEKTPEHEKLLKTQYEDFFKQRENTASNFKHNFGVYCRREASSPIDAVQIAKEITGRMDKEEKQKTFRLLKQIAKEDETITQVLVRTYLYAIKEVPLNEEYIKNNMSEKMIARPFYDTVSTKGQPVDKDSNLRVGDSIQNLAFNLDKVFGKGKDKIYENLTVVSSSKEGNKIVLMDKDKSFYEVPRDTLLEGYNKQQKKQHKAEIRQQHHNRIDVGWER